MPPAEVQNTKGSTCSQKECDANIHDEKNSCLYLCSDSCCSTKMPGSCAGARSLIQEDTPADKVGGKDGDKSPDKDPNGEQACNENSDCAKGQSCCRWNNEKGGNDDKGTCNDMCAMSIIIEEPTLCLGGQLAATSLEDPVMCGLNAAGGAALPDAGSSCYFCGKMGGDSCCDKHSTPADLPTLEPTSDVEEEEEGEPEEESTEPEEGATTTTTSNGAPKCRDCSRARALLFATRPTGNEAELPCCDYEVPCCDDNDCSDDLSCMYSGAPDEDCMNGTCRDPNANDEDIARGRRA